MQIRMPGKNNRGRPRGTETSLYLRIQSDIRRQIVLGRMGPDDILPSEQELATRYGVSVPTMRQAQQVLVKEGLLRKEHGRGTFVTGKARNLRRCLLVCGLASLPDGRPPIHVASPYYLDSMQFCVEAAHQGGLPLETAWIESDQDSKVPGGQAGHVAGEHSGYIFLGCQPLHPHLRHAQRDGIPHVSLGRLQPLERSVWFDLAEAAQQAWDAIRPTVLDRGLVVTVVYIEGDEVGAQMLERIVPGDVRHLRIPTPQPTWDYERLGYELVHRVAGAGGKPRAYVFLDDILARGGTRALLSAGSGHARSPVVVVGGRQQMVPYGMPVTYVTHDTRTEARWAVEMLTAQLDGNAAGSLSRRSPFSLTAGPDPLRAVTVPVFDAALAEKA